MKRIKILAIATAAGLGLTACNRSDLQTPAPGKPNDLTVEVSLATEPLNQTGKGSFAPAASIKAAREAEKSGVVVVYGAEDEPATKSTNELAPADDAKVHNLWAIQFRADGTLLGEPFYTTDIPEPGTGGAGVDATYNLAVQLTTNTEPGGKVYFIANIHSPNTFNATNAATEAKLHEVVKSIGTELKPTTAGGIPMLGVYTGKVESSGTLTTVSMKRLLAKVVLKYKINPAFQNFEVTGVRMRNVAENIHFGPEPTGIFPAKAAGSHIDYPAEDLTQATTDGDYKKFVWYVPENLRGVASGVSAVKDRNLSKTDGKATYIELTGAVTKSATRPQKAIYRFLLGDPATNPGDFNVRRNNVYTLSVDIQGINTADSRVEVETFDMNNSAMVQPKTGNVTFDIRKCLSNGFTNESQLNTMLSSGAWRVAVLWQDVAVNNYVTINYNLPGKADDKSLGIFSVKSNNGNSGNAVVALYNNATSGGTILWSWHVWVTDYQPDGGQSYNLGINSKLAVPGGEVHTYGPQYQTAANGIKPQRTDLRVIMDRNLGATGVLYDLPTTKAQNYPTYGFHYQWGRKDPFPKAATQGTNVATQPTYQVDGTTVTNYPKLIKGPVSLSTAVQNPQIFYFNKDDEQDWLSSQNNALWGDGAVKSAYDPCPKGWRVAPNGTWDDFGDTWKSGSYVDAGFYKNSTWVTGVNMDIAGGVYYGGSAESVKAFYPVPGYRASITGVFWSVASNGASWASTILMKNSRDEWGHHISYNATVLHPNGGSARAHGHPVRCIQE